MIYFFLIWLSTQAQSRVPQSPVQTQFEAQAHHMSFRYVPFEGESQSCRHERIRDLPDWNVVCGEGRWERRFKVHLVARRYDRADKVSAFEVLYWVTDYKESRPQYGGTSMMFTLDRYVKSQKLKLGQAVEGHIAELELTLVAGTE